MNKQIEDLKDELGIAIGESFDGRGFYYTVQMEEAINEAVGRIIDIVKAYQDRMGIQGKSIKQLAKEHGFEPRTKEQKRTAFELAKDEG